MKKLGLLIFLTGVMGLTACGPSQDDPEKKYRDQGLVPADTKQDNTKVVYRYIERRVTVLQGVDSEDPRGTDGDGQVVLQNAVFTVTTPDNINFVEGKAGEFDFTVKFAKTNVDFSIDDSGLPKGAKITAVDAGSGKFKFSWTPSGIIPAGQPDMEAIFKLALKDVKFENTADQKTYDTLQLKTRDISIVIRKNDVKPSLVVNGLDGARNEGEVYKFSVDVTAPAGYTGEPLAPDIFYDNANLINDKGMVEQNGGYFISIDPDNSGAEELGKGKWRFHYVFDTQNVGMLPQFDKNLKQVDNATKLYVRVSFRVSSEKVAVSDKTTNKFFINLK